MKKNRDDKIIDVVELEAAKLRKEQRKERGKQILKACAVNALICGVGAVTSYGVTRGCYKLWGNPKIK